MAVTTQSESRRRISALRDLLGKGDSSTQEELAEALKLLEIQVTQSTISRDLRRLGATKAIDANGRTVYRLPQEPLINPVSPSGLKGLLLDIKHNGSVIVLHTSIGSASLVARHLDVVKPHGILGTLAGDDTIFVAPASAKKIDETLNAILEELS
jgi:transcriptional regulator of arginine metabolism